MSTYLETIADELARDTLAAVKKTGDDKLVAQVSDAVGSSSPTFQEAFNTAIRLRRAELRGRDILKALADGQDGNG